MGVVSFPDQNPFLTRNRPVSLMRLPGLLLLSAESPPFTIVPDRVQVSVESPTRVLVDDAFTLAGKR
jgi:hypothetical protein